MASISVGGGGGPSSQYTGYYLRPTGALAETLPRFFFSSTNSSALTSGTLKLTGIELYAGQTVTSITYASGSTAANGPTNQFFGLYSSALAKLAESANDTTTAWGANANKTLAMSTPYTVTASGLFYLAIMVTATVAVPTLVCQQGGLSQPYNVAPIINGNSTTGLTTSIPATAAALSGAHNTIPYAYVT